MVSAKLLKTKCYSRQCATDLRNSILVLLLTPPHDPVFCAMIAKYSSVPFWETWRCCEFLHLSRTDV